VAPVAPAYLASATPKLLPKSPKSAADNNASQIACAATSPSEWPSRPISFSQINPARDNFLLLSAVNACASTPIPTLYFLSLSGIKNFNALAISDGVVILSAHCSPVTTLTAIPSASIKAGAI
jgi:hypothetical protein